MINKQTIISAFDEKLTLMQWLKTIEKALKDAVLTSVSISQPESDKVVFIFVFEDGSTITSPVITLPVGPQGPQGEQGPQGPQGPAGEGGTKLYLHKLVNQDNYGLWLLSNDNTLINSANINQTMPHIIAIYGESGDGVNWHRPYTDLPLIFDNIMGLIATNGFAQFPIKSDEVTELL